LYHKTLPDALQAIYPQLPWEPQKFLSKLPAEHWDTHKLMGVLSKTEELLGIQRVSVVDGGWWVVS